MQTNNNSGPNIEPTGTPLFAVAALEKTPELELTGVL